MAKGTVASPKPKKSGTPPATEKRRSTLPPPDPDIRALLDKIVGSRPEIRPGNMFGCPGYFVGKKSVGCVFGGEGCLTLPAAEVEKLVMRTGYRKFEAGGRTMSGWILLSKARVTELAKDGALVEAAIAYARSKA